MIPFALSSEIGKTNCGGKFRRMDAQEEKQSSDYWWVPEVLVMLFLKLSDGYMCVHIVTIR